LSGAVAIARSRIGAVTGSKPDGEDNSETDNDSGRDRLGTHHYTPSDVG
jgi:hypothetical protein